MQLNDANSASTKSPKPLTSCLKTSRNSKLAENEAVRSCNQQSTIVTVEDCQEDEEKKQTSASINYWHYKKTGIKSRPIKLLEHPIEHIERKLVYTYLLGILFKVLAIILGPIISLLLLLIALPFLLFRRLTWFLLNLKCLFDARIKKPSYGSSYEWKYCPLTFLESYWFRDKLLNHVILVVSNGKDGFSLDKLRSLIEKNVLSDTYYRKFLSCVVARGIPFYRGYYWLFTGDLFIENVRKNNSQIIDKKSGEVPIVINDDNFEPKSSSTSFMIENHIFIDESLSGLPVINLKAIRDYTYNLLDSKLNPTRPLWELRAVPSKKKTYLIFRCHQCLADGKNMTKILMDHLTNHSPIDRANTKEVECDEKEEEENENKLVPIREKPSFISKMGESNGFKNAIIVGPLTVLLWVIWTFTRRKNNHLNKCAIGMGESSSSLIEKLAKDKRRFHMNFYDLTKFHQIRQITRCTVSDIILCALSGSLREYLRKLNAVSNPPNLNISLSIDMTSKLDEERKKYDKLVDYTLISMPLPTSIEGTIPRLWDLRNTMEELRTSLDPWIIIAMKKFLFTVLPVSSYQWLINYITLRNSSVLVSNIRGPINTVESWCEDLIQKTAHDAQQPPKIVLVSGQQLPPQQKTKTKDTHFLHIRGDRKQKVSAIYYCFQPPTSKIPISFNCITYRNKMFITALSRSLLVEDSKILIRLFCMQLDQLIDSIAKRRKVFTIISGPKPLEQDLESIDTSESNLKQKETLESQFRTISVTDQVKEKRVVISRYDLEASVEYRSPTKCKLCHQTICVCKRRKSMFSFDNLKQSDMLRRLIPPKLISVKNDEPCSRIEFESQEDLELPVVNNTETVLEVEPLRSSHQAVKRSSWSLGAPTSDKDISSGHLESALTLISRASKVLMPASNKAQNRRLNYSKSDTNLSPTGLNKSFWEKSLKGRSHLSSKTSTNGESENIGGLQLRSPRQISRTSSRVRSAARLQRRQSIATTSSSGRLNQTRLLVKDELNVNVELRYHPDKAFLRGCQTRRSRKEPRTVDTGRRSSLIPFGLLPSQNIPKLLHGDGEAHL